MLLRIFAISFFVLGFSLSVALAADETLLQDTNGDGAISLLAFGDSLTAGIGDGIEVGQYVEDLDGTASYSGGGYPARVQSLSGVIVYNRGVPGENLVEVGFDRFPGVVSGSSADIVNIMEGSNDALVRLDSGDYRRSIQRLVNVAKAVGKTPILMTIPPPCCNHAGPDMYVRAFNEELKQLAAWNEVPLVDIARAWKTTCENQEACELFNIPEGEHPNKRGYDVIAQTVLATLYGVDVFAADGAAKLESVLGLQAGSVIVKPDVVSE